MNHPEIENMHRFGHKSPCDLSDEIKEENTYLEDIFGEEIKIGDEFVENEHGEFIHERSAFKHLCDMYKKKTR